MNRFEELQLGLWREACQHIDLARSISDLAAAIHQYVPLDDMLVFGLDGERCTLTASLRSAVSAAEIDRDGVRLITRFARRGGLSLFNPERPGRSLLRPLAPIVAPGPVVCGALQRQGTPEGVVVWRLGTGVALDDRTSRLLAGTLEPITVALDTSRRFHELEALKRAAEAESQSALRRLGRESLREPIVGEHCGLKMVMERVSVVAGSDLPVLILGETGSGKEVIARAIHDRSRRHDGPFLRVNCGAIPPELIDSQLFGHERGAFTGATEQRQGWFERADGGTLFLDEVGELPRAAQVRLLRVLQDGTLERVGGQQTITIDCRIIAATHRDLSMMVRERTFREDLWYRIAVFPLVLPPLRERQEDLPSLVEHFTHRASIRFGLPPFTVTDDDLARLRQYRWPGNIRELAAVIDRAALLGMNGHLAISAALGSGGVYPPVSKERETQIESSSARTLEAAVRAAIEAALSASRGRVEGAAGAAAALGLNPSTLRSKMRKLGLDADRFR
ncbi:MAG: sigma-54-dependent Fis family transcriptional regulator [Phycisphaeraceae bacterium]|nr:sigma-54-dependent Fis family transcriptional regulator [Phycisphaeraceae bacterium]